MLDRIVFGLQIILAISGVYQLVLTFFGWFRQKRKQSFKPQKSFAILVAAHNEEAVVGALIENLKGLNYPKDLYDVMVICDNCNDGTADIARSHGVYAFERFNPSLRGKGYAIEWMLKELWKLPRSYDGVVIFDADNLVEKDFLIHMNNDLCSGHRVVQAYLDTKNPYDSWVTSSYAISYWFCNRLWQMSRTNLGMANFLGGTGMCFESSLLKEMGWGATSLVEDLEFTMRCIKRGINPYFDYDAKVYDEKPLSFKASARQRLRWMQGHFDVARRYFFPLLGRGLKEASWTKIDAAFYALNAYNFLLGAVVTCLLWADQLINNGNPYFTSLFEQAPLAFAILYGMNIIVLPAVLLVEKIPLKIWKSLILFPVFMVTWYPITLYAFFTQNNKQWSHTQHTRAIRLEEVRSKQAS
ncbi:MAG: glycosyl transferase [Paenibacillaceae bacterium]|nr:glycosyl transferase [Paenibacillaceae bacterium]